MPTVGQVKRALEWEVYLAKPRLKRGKSTPRCVTCGAQAIGTFAVGQPQYDCGPHEPITISRDDLARGRRKFGREG
jgi:hypothetical protein